jgi:uncharacterized protein YcbK (DUF882 family)
VALPFALAACSTGDADATERRLAIYNVNPLESLDVVYWADGEYRADALSRIDHIMRDRRTDEVAAIDLRLVDMLHELHRSSGSDEPFQLVSAYRSKGSNEARQRAGAGVAEQSYHTLGMAADVGLRDVSLGRLHRTALAMGAGGVGLYPASGFLHVDSGPVRTWAS